MNNSITRSCAAAFLTVAFATINATASVTWHKKTAVPTVLGTSCIVSTPSRDTIITGTFDNGIFMSPDGGTTWLHTYHSTSDTAIYCITHTGSNIVIAGTDNGILRSADNGLTWIKASAPVHHPVRQIVKTGDRIYACTGDYSFGVDMGDGVLCSEDGGITWHSMNTGLPAHHAVWQLAADSHGYLYALCPDAPGIGNGGLYLSQNEGTSWAQFPMNIDGRGVVPDNLRFSEGLALAVTPDDSVLCSGYAIGGGVSVTGIFRTTREQAATGAHWRLSGLRPVASFWLCTPSYTFWFADDKRVMGSNAAGASAGGPYYSLDKGNVWIRAINGVDIMSTGYNANAYTAGPANRIYMIQQGDDDIYYTDDLPAATPTVIKDAQLLSVRIYPNPSSGIIQLKGAASSADISIIAADGRLMTFSATYSGDTIHIGHELADGVYVIRFTAYDGSRCARTFTVAH